MKLDYAESLLRPDQIVTPFTGVWIEISFCCVAYHLKMVTPFTGVWIEIEKDEAEACAETVTPFTGVWIEIGYRVGASWISRKSHPSRVCGLKCLSGTRLRFGRGVTPFTGVWIEILSKSKPNIIYNVTPFTGVWIEILHPCL